MLQVDSGLRNLIESRDAARVGLVPALGDDEGGELLGDIDIGLFESAAGECAAAAVAWSADHSLARRESGREVVIADAGETLVVSKGGERDLAEDRRLAIAERSGDGAIGIDVEIHQGATASAILLGGSSAARSGHLPEKSVFAGVEMNSS